MSVVAARWILDDFDQQSFCLQVEFYCWRMLKECFLHLDVQKFCQKIPGLTVSHYQKMRLFAKILQLQVLCPGSSFLGWCCWSCHHTTLRQSSSSCGTSRCRKGAGISECHVCWHLGTIEVATLEVLQNKHIAEIYTAPTT